MNQSQTFEQAYERLETILEKMNNGQVPLEEALTLFKEAESLITRCQKQLQDAEKEIEVLLKNKDGTVATDEYDQPQLEPFVLQRQSPLE